MKKQFNKCILILARGGSKSIPKKNLYPLNGIPLIQYTINTSIKSDINKIFVSTDDSDIKQFCQNFDVNVVDRPKEFATDFTTDFLTIHNFLQNHNNDFDYIVHLRPTFPKITPEIINFASELFEEKFNDFDSLRSVIKSSESPFKSWLIEENNMVPVIKGNKMHSSPRQLVPQTYFQNACIDIIKTETILVKNDIIGSKCLPFIMPDGFDFDIDTYDDLRRF
jgi:N-acylneuraminate cytidylyltransferase